MTGMHSLSRSTCGFCRLSRAERSLGILSGPFLSHLCRDGCERGATACERVVDEAIDSDHEIAAFGVHLLAHIGSMHML